MTPQDAIQMLTARGWSEARIANAVGCSQPTIHRIKKSEASRGVSWETGNALIALAVEDQAAAHAVGVAPEAAA